MAPRVRRPASENLQGKKPRLWNVRPCRRRYGDLSAAGAGRRRESVFSNSVADPWILLHSEMVGRRKELTAASAAQALEQKMIARKECAVALRALASRAISNAVPATIRRYAEGLPEA